LTAHRRLAGHDFVLRARPEGLSHVRSGRGNAVAVLAVTGDVAARRGSDFGDRQLVAPAFIFAGCTCVLSIFAILKAALPRNGSQDAFVLLRRLYEYAVTFSWIAIDPAVNTKAWLAHDYKSRLKMNRELKDLGVPGIDPTAEAKFQNYIAACPKQMPDLRVRAVEADAHWAGKISTHSRRQPLPVAQISFETLYTNIYRWASTDAHAATGSIHHFVSGRGGGRFTIGIKESDEGDRYPYTFAPPVLAEWLLVAEHVLGWPAASDVHAAFSNWSASPDPVMCQNAIG